MGVKDSVLKSEAMPPLISSFPLSLLFTQTIHSQSVLLENSKMFKSFISQTGIEVLKPAIYIDIDQNSSIQQVDTTCLLCELIVQVVDFQVECKAIIYQLDLQAIIDIVVELGLRPKAVCEYF